MRYGRLLPLAGVSLIALGSGLRAQEATEADAYSLDTIYVVSEGQDNVEATGGTVVTEEDLQRLQPADVSELFARESSITVSGGGGPSKRIHVFGIEQSNLAVSVDGVPQVATSWHHTGSNVIDPAYLKAVEVEAGAAAADSGFGAAAGAIRYETKGAYDLLEAGQVVGGQASLSYGTNGRGVSASLAGYGQYGGFDWFIMAHGTDGDNYESGDGVEMEGTEPSSRSVLAKLGYEFEDHRIELNVEHSKDDGDRLVKANMTAPSSVELGEFPLESTRDTVRLSYTSTAPTAAWDPEFSVYYSQFEYWRPNYTTRTNGNMILNEDLFGGKMENTFSLGTSKITAGIDFGQHDYATDNYGNNDQRYRDFSTTQLGVYAQGRFDFENGFSLSTGMRYDSHRFTDWNGERFSDSGASTNATLAYKINDNIELFAGASRTFLGYVIADYGYVHARDSSFYTEPDFDTGSSKNIKLGANFGGENWSGGFTYFDTKINGLPNYDSPSLKNDPDELRSRGFTLNAQYDFGGTRVGATFTRADVTEGGEPAVPSSGAVMPVGKLATVYVDHDLKDLGATVGASVEWAGSLPALTTGSTTFYEQPSYTVVNAYAEWTPPSYSKVVVRLGVDNLFDKTYFERSSYATSSTRGGIDPVYAPGRTVTLGATVKF